MTLLRFHILILGLVLFSSTLLFGQVTEPKKKDLFSVLESDSIPEIDMGADTVNAYLRKKGKTKKKKTKKKVFYGIKTKKGYTRVGDGERVIIELFYVLKKYQDPNPYIPEIYVWDMSEGKIKKVSKVPEDKRQIYKILHGPYKKLYNGEIIEEGVFYVGTKTSRWEKYDKKNILIGKTKYYRGWPKEAKITYFDGGYKKPKEVIPYEYGIKQGNYYLFSDNGMVKIKGQFENGKRVGKWTEYFDKSERKQREIQYQEDAYAEDIEPVITKEWNDKGAVIILDGKTVEPGSIKEEDPIKKRLKRKTY